MEDDGGGADRGDDGGDDGGDGDDHDGGAQLGKIHQASIA